MANQSLPAKVEDGLANEKLIRTLRQSVKPPGKKGTWMNMLNDSQLVEVYYRLQAGKPAYAIVKIAQNEWGIKRDADAKSMARSVREFRDRTLGEIGALASGVATHSVEMCKTLANKAKRIGDKIDVLGRMAWLIEIQSERIELLHTAEKKSLPFKHTETAVRALGELLGQYVKIQIDLGLIQRQPDEFNLHVQHSFSKIQAGLGGQGPAAANALGKFLAWAEEEAVHMKLDPETGSYVPIQEESGNAAVHQ